MGRNGAGKTTLMRVFAGAMTPTHGSITVGGVNIHRDAQTRLEHRARLGWVPQGATLPRNMTAGDFMRYAAWLQRVHVRDSDTAVRDALKASGSLELRDRRIGRMSGGERQRIVLAASLVANPSLILLDEPTVGLDPAQREAYLDNIRMLGRNATVVYSTHLVDDVERIAEHVVLLDCGEVAFARTREAVASSAASLGDALRSAVVNTADRNLGQR